MFQRKQSEIFICTHKVRDLKSYSGEWELCYLVCVPKFAFRFVPYGVTFHCADDGGAEGKETRLDVMASRVGQIKQTTPTSQPTHLAEWSASSHSHIHLSTYLFHSYYGMPTEYQRHSWVLGACR